MATLPGIYLALFGRPADPLGLAFFNAQTNGGQDLTSIGSLSGTAEYQGRFEGMSKSDVINSIYVSLFGRSADDAGLNFFVQEWDAGRQDINSIAINILDGAKGDDLTIINNKLTASLNFTAHLDMQAEVDAYKGDFAAETGRDFLDGITTDTSTIPDDEVTDQQILFLFRDVLFNTRVLTSLGGDGTKNLYTFLYHILYEKGTWFHGMNYPYGEHLVFTDAQPLFSIPLSYLNTSLHFSIHTLLAFMYWSYWILTNEEFINQLKS